MRNVLIAALLVVGLAALAVPVVAQEDAKPDLAERCEAVKWFVPQGSSDMLPPDLRKIVTELRERGVEALGDIEKGLDKSKHLRRIAPDVVDAWPCDRSRAVLIRLVADGDAFTAQSAAFSLGMVGGAEVVASLVKAGERPEAMVRHNAINSLGGIGAVRNGLPLAIAATSAREAWMRHTAYQYLEAVDWGDGIAAALKALEGVVFREPDRDAKAAGERAIRVLKARSD